MAEREKAKISVVMVSWHTGPVLFDAIHAVLRAPDVHELVLVNHGNPAPAVEALDAAAARHERFTLIHSGGNLGYSKGCNIGAKAATGTHLFFLNPDAILVPGTAARMAETASGLEEPWVVGARILDREGQEQRGARRGDLSLSSAFLGFTGLARFIPGVRNVHREHEPVPEQPVDTPCVSGAALMMARESYHAIGGFDEEYFLHVEDIDLCHRVRRQGGRVVFDPRAELVHYGSTSKESIFFVERHKANGLLRYFWRYASPAGRFGVALTAPFLWLALMGRAVLIAARRGYSAA